MKKILIIDDEQAYSQVLSDTLKVKYECFTAENGKKGLEMAFNHQPDLILLDISMPVMDGQTTLKELRKDKWGKTANVIFLTNLEPSPEIVQQAVSDSPTLYVVKSAISLEELQTKIEEALTQ